jgi:hypothetical protein
MSSSRPLLRGFVRGLSATTFALGALALLGFIREVSVTGGPLTPGLAVMMVLLSAGGPAAATLAQVLAWKSWDRRDARVLATFLALLSYPLAGEPVWGMLRASGIPRWGIMAVDTLFPLAAVAAMAMLIRFSALFPRPLNPGDLRAHSRSRAARFVVAAQVWTMGGTRLRRAALWFCMLAVVLPQAISIASGGGAAGMIAGQISRYVTVAALLATLVIAPANLRASYRRADAAERRHIFWVLEGCVLVAAVVLIASALKLLQNATGYTPPVPYWFALSLMGGFMGLLTCLAFAMFGSGALDPALAIRRTAVASAVGLMTVVLFATLEQLLQGYVGARLGLSDRAGGVLTGVAVGLAFEPVRGRTIVLVERLLGAPRPAAETASAQPAVSAPAVPA